ncbi:hypothetical protein QWA68_000294 [Fusarium oxysporum]|nr:hypothetical protein H9L39_07401 [Fusarium oxysporum f. sp. albedinis]KAK2701100.1 hypothetical protein QWA68_000294 [Fusarium oxysporum]
MIRLTLLYQGPSSDELLDRCVVCSNGHAVNYVDRLHLTMVASASYPKKLSRVSIKKRSSSWQHLLWN